MINNGEIKKKKLLFYLIVITFIVIIIAWYFYLKIFPLKSEKTEDDTFFSELINKGVETKENLQGIFQEIKNLSAPSFLGKELNDETLQGQKQEESPTSETLLDKKAEKLKEKILEYLNQDIKP